MNAVSPALLEVLKAILYNTYLSVEKGKEVMITLRGEEGRRKREYNENKRLENEGKENRDWGGKENQEKKKLLMNKKTHKRKRRIEERKKYGQKGNEK